MLKDARVVEAARHVGGERPLRAVLAQHPAAVRMDVLSKVRKRCGP